MNKNTKHYLIYQITNNINQKFYIGKHETYNIDDNYFGSGKYLKYAIKKHGIENFTKTILFELQNKEEMNLLEKMVVTPEFCAREDTYNINVGGDGGWDYLNGPNSSYPKGSVKRHNAMVKANKNKDWKSITKKNKTTWENKKQNTIEFKKFKNACSQKSKKFFNEHPGILAGENNPMFGKHHSDESCKKMSETHKGDKNSMYGKIWICNFELEESKIWNANEPIPTDWIKGRHSKIQFKQIKNKVKELEQQLNLKTQTQIDKLQQLNMLKNEKQHIKDLAKQEKLLKQQLENQQKQEIKEKKKQLLHAMFEEFKKNEFEGVVKKFGYKHTRNNLIMAFKAYIPEYIPKVCNRWKNRK